MILSVDTFFMKNDLRAGLPAGRYMAMRAEWENIFHLSQIYSRGITGKGIAAAVLDTGIYEHEDFRFPKNRICCFRDFIMERICPMMITGTVPM